jgi:hypothetical protein
MAAAEETPPPVTEEAITWAFRLLIGRDPFGPEEIHNHKHFRNLEHLRLGFANTWEFQDFFDRLSFGKPHYRMPIFLMRPPTDRAIPFAFTPPDLDNPVSQMATQAQFRDPVYTEIVREMRLKPEESRRQWEMVWVVSVLATAGLVSQGRRILGLNVERQRLPALFTSRGVEVMVADKIEPDADPDRRRRLRSSQLFNPEIVNLDDFERLLRWEMLDLEALPPALEGMFDAVWSTAFLEKLGPRERALAALKGTLGCLKPGGLAVHTLALNIASNVNTVNHAEFTALRRRDLETLAQELRADGHSVDTLNFHPGLAPEDEEIFSAPGSKQRPKWRHGAHVLTSFGLVIRKRA